MGQPRKGQGWGQSAPTPFLGTQRCGGLLGLISTWPWGLPDLWPVGSGLHVTPVVTDGTLWDTTPGGGLALCRARPPLGRLEKGCRASGDGS